MTVTTLLLLIALLELILIAIQQKKIKDTYNRGVAADVEIFHLVAEIAKVLRDYEKRIKKLEENKE